MRHKHTRRPRYRKIELLDTRDLLDRLQLWSSGSGSASDRVTPAEVDAVIERLNDLGVPFHRNHHGVICEASELADALARSSMGGGSGRPR